MVRPWRLGFLLAVLLAMLPLPASGQGHSQTRTWEITIVPYVWLSNVTGGNALGDQRVTVGDSSLSPAGAVRVEARRHRVALRLTATRATIAHPGAISLRTDPTQQSFGRYDLAWTTVEAHSALRIGPLDPITSFAVYAGFRYVHQRQRLRDATGVETMASQAWVEPVEGSQYVVQVGRRFLVTIAGDIGGFAVGSDFTWTLNAETAFRAAGPLHLAMRYTYRQVQYDNKETGAKTYRWDGVQQGWFFGAAVEFPSP